MLRAIRKTQSSWKTIYAAQNWQIKKGWCTEDCTILILKSNQAKKLKHTSARTDRQRMNLSCQQSVSAAIAQLCSHRRRTSSLHLCTNAQLLLALWTTVGMSVYVLSSRAAVLQDNTSEHAMTAEKVQLVWAIAKPMTELASSSLMKSTFQSITVAVAVHCVHPSVVWLPLFTNTHKHRHIHFHFLSSRTTNKNNICKW